MSKTARERLREYCTRHGYKQRELAELLEIHDAYLSQMLSGLRRPGLPIAVRIQDMTGIPVASWLLTPRGAKSKARKSPTKTVNVGKGETADAPR
jgi:transcriptional regulator with XRE-family HTH domain